MKWIITKVPDEVRNETSDKLEKMEMADEAFRGIGIALMVIYIVLAIVAIDCVVLSMFGLI